ncbi:MAG: 16S rRNA (guanine(966)-N(2))-methyltransferase RsmD [Desulfarculaceae bacterium]|nr:16S rRNA (guanine(966)-N(2))-methyltransferase RsmD [Desulfarculaceae bacterium]
MRIISGRFKGRKLTAPENRSIRPTSDKAREAVFSIIGSKVEKACILDLFAGTGAFGIEAISRGARRTTFVETSEKALDTIEKNINLLGIENEADLIQGPIPHVFTRGEFSGRTFEIIFLDPPYDGNFITSTLENTHFLNFVTESTLVIAEHPIFRQEIALSGHLELIDRRKYGKTMISFFRKP